MSMLGALRKSVRCLAHAQPFAVAHAHNHTERVAEYSFAVYFSSCCGKKCCACIRTSDAIWS